SLWVPGRQPSASLTRRGAEASPDVGNDADGEQPSQSRGACRAPRRSGPPGMRNGVSMSTQFRSAAARCAHAGQARLDGEPLVAPLVQSTSFGRAGLQSRAEHAYSRVSNPTVAALERTLGELEDAPPAVTFATGLAAETALLLATVQAGDHVVCGR